MQDDDVEAQTANYGGKASLRSPSFCLERWWPYGQRKRLRQVSDTCSIAEPHSSMKYCAADIYLRKTQTDAPTLPQHPEVHWLGSFLRPFGGNTQKIEQHRSEDSPLYLTALDLLFGLPGNYIHELPGILLFFRHLDNCFSVLIEQKYDVVWTLLGRSVPSDPMAGWEWCFAVMRALSDARDVDASLENVHSTLLRKSQLSAHALDDNAKEEALRAIFASLCWMSMALKPVLNRKPLSSSSPASILAGTWAEDSDHIVSRHALRRPVVKTFRAFRQSVDQSQADTSPSSFHTALPTLEPSEILYESSLNYFSLHNTGRVRLEWVDLLTSHLRFNRQKRTLSLFRFPSMCIAAIVGKGGNRVVKQQVAFNTDACLELGILTNCSRIIAELLPPDHYYTDFAQDDDLSSVHREVLLSYRLLFAQSARSRKLIKKHLGELPSNLDVDPLLVTLCCTPLKSLHGNSRIPNRIFPYSTLNEDGTLQQSDTYSIRDDFPSFGSRLLALQRYNLRQQPSRVKDFWRDRRNPLQWYTFWAVLWVGGISIVLGALQLLVGIAQLYFAAAPGS